MAVATVPAGWRVFGLSVAALAVVSLAFGDFNPGQPIPKTISDRTVLAYGAAIVMLIAGATMTWRRTLFWGAAALTAYFGLIVTVLMDGPVILRHRAEFIAYSNTAEQAAIAAAALIILAASANIGAPLAGRLTRIGQAAFGICAILFGGAHFFYMNMTAPIVPKWLPPSQLFWGYATGVAHIAGGLAILTGIRARLAAILLTIMYALFTPLVLVPLLLADPSGHGIWAENVTNLVLVGAAWVVATSLSQARRR